MATVTVLGLGNMGAALAEAFSAAGHATTGWTRSGTTGSPAAACAASDLVVACVIDYDATYEVLAAPGVTEALRGKTFVQLATGGPADARAMAEWATGEGVAYLDGSIATYPARIGDEPTIIFYSGDRAAFDGHRTTLAALGGRPTFVGEAVGGAAAADLAWLSFLYGNMIGLFQGAAFLESEGVDPSVVFDAVPSFGVEIAAEAALARDLIARQRLQRRPGGPVHAPGGHGGHPRRRRAGRRQQRVPAPGARPDSASGRGRASRARDRRADRDPAAQLSAGRDGVDELAARHASRP